MELLKTVIMEKCLKCSEEEKVNLKKEFQFFATPSNLADRLVELAETNNRW